MGKREGTQTSQLLTETGAQAGPAGTGCTVARLLGARKEAAIEGNLGARP